MLTENTEHIRKFKKSEASHQSPKIITDTYA